MNTSITDIEKKVLSVIQHGMPVSLSPYADMASEAGIETEELLSVLRRWQQEGKLRRTGAIVNHFKVGLSAAVMVVWNVPAEKIDEIGALFAGFKEVSHAYQRPASESWPFNLYTMVHGETSEQVLATAEEMSKASGISDYRQLKTIKELKKVAQTYV